LDYFYFYPGMSVISLLITEVPSHEIYVRSVVLVGFIIFGILISMVVAKRERAEERVAHLNLVLQAIRNVNQLIVREKDRARLIQSACDHLTETRGYYSAWIVLFDAAGEVKATAQSGLNEDVASRFAQLCRDELPPCGQQALAQTEVVIIPKPTTCVDCSLAEDYVDHGAMTVRLAHAGQVYGLLGVTLPASLVKDAKEQALLHEVASDVAFALHSIEVEEARARAEAALRESEERFRLTFHTSPDAINVNRLEDGLYVDINEGFTQLTGYARADVIGKTSLELDIWHDPADRQKLVEGLRERGYYKNLEAQFRRKDGSVTTALMSARVISLQGRPHIISITRDISARKEAKEALRESESRLRAVLRYTPAIIYLKDRQGRFTLINRAFEDAFEVSQDEILGKTDFDLMPAEMAATFRRHDEQVMELGQPLQVEETAIQPDGEQHVALSNKFPMYDAEGELCGVGGISTDITARKQMEEALLESEQKYRTLFESALNPIFIADDQGRYVDANPAALEFLECDRETLLGKRVWDFSPPGSLERDQQEHAPFVGRRTLETEYFVHGEIKTLLLSVTPLELKGETVLYGIGQDITERKRAEEERARLAAQVREQAQQMEQILTTVPTGVLLLDAEWRVLRANPTAKGDLAELADVNVGDLLTHLGDRPLPDLLTSPPTRGLWHEVKSDGSTFEVIARSMLTSTSKDAGPMSEQWVLVINDVTREREIRSQLQQQERLAAVGQMAAGIAHDFNNIMAVVVLYAQLSLRTPNLPAKIGERLQIISQQAKRATDLIEQILDFSRRAMLERRPLDLLPLLKEQVKLLERTLPEHIEIQLDYEPEIYTIHADPTRMQQMITNLAVNARDAMPEGGTLRIALERMTLTPDQTPPLLEMEAGDWLRLSVADTGTGIPPEVLPHIFEPFFTTKQPGEGSGLGLPQVHGIVGLHGGYIDVETRVGEGTTFIIYLPAMAQKPTEAPGEEVAEMPLGHGETILVVEDEEVVRAALVATLEQLNYRVLQASNGQEALNILALRADEITLVLSDFVMPVMGGRRLFGAMQQQGFDLPVVLLSGHPLEDELREMQDQGLADWMLKPPNIEQLAKVLAQALKGRAG
jgi:PAS domain S-box-containing protein